MDLYEVSKSGKSVTKYTLVANEKLAEYKNSLRKDILLYQFETTDKLLMEKVCACDEISFHEINSKNKVDFHSALGSFDMREGSFSYSELKRISSWYYFSLFDRALLENTWLEYVHGTYSPSNSLSVYLGCSESRLNYCNYLLLPSEYQTVSSKKLNGEILNSYAEDIGTVYSMKNIFDLPEELYGLELLEQGKYQHFVDLSLVIPEAFSYYSVSSYERYPIQELEQDSMHQVASTIDIQKNLLKSIRKGQSWKLK